MSTHSVKIISAEGNIGSGKSTFIANLKKKLHDNKDFMFLEEPVKEWESIKDEQGLSMLSKFYADQDRWSFAFQMMAYISRLAYLRNAMIKAEKNNVKYIVSERCVDTDRFVFAQMLFDDNKLDKAEFDIYKRWYYEFLKDIPVHARIYIETSPTICSERVAKRARTGEVIPLAYLEKCHKYHNNWIEAQKENNTSVLSLDGNQDVFADTSVMESWLNKLDDFLSKI